MKENNGYSNKKRNIIGNGKMIKKKRIMKMKYLLITSNLTNDN
jgi:hypothetical protein